MRNILMPLLIEALLVFCPQCGAAATTLWPSLTMYGNFLVIGLLPRRFSCCAMESSDMLGKGDAKPNYQGW